MAKQQAQDTQAQYALTFTVDPRRVYEFHLKKPRTGKVLIQKECEIIDDITGRKRKVRFHPDSISPFLDEQEGLEPATGGYPIIFDGSILRVAGYDEPLIRFLLAHEANVKRKQVLHASVNEYLFEIYDHAEVSAKKVEAEELKLDAMLVARDKIKNDLKQLEYFMQSVFGIKNEEIGEFKTEVYAKVEDYPKLFLEDLNNTKHKIKFDIIDALERGLIVVAKNGEASWKTGTIIGLFPKDESGNVHEAMSVWASSNQKGVKEFKELLESNLSKEK